MHLFKFALSLALLAGSALAQKTRLMYPPPGTDVTAGSDITVQVDIQTSDVNVVAIVIGLAQCYEKCAAGSEIMGTILHQGPHTPEAGYSYGNYSVTVPAGEHAGTASLNLISFYLYGAENSPVLEYLGHNVTVVA